MSKEEILEQLRKIVLEKGGKRKKSSKWASIAPELYKNQYVDDGSVDYAKTRMAIIKNIAKAITGKQAEALTNFDIKSVPESMINKQLNLAKKRREVEIKKEKRDDMYAQNVANVMQSEEKKVKLKNDLVKAKTKATDIIKYDEIMHPQLYENKAFNSVAMPTVKDKRLKALQDNQLVVAQGRRKRPLSEYNMFVRDYMKKHKNASLADAADVWSGQGRRRRRK